MENNKQNMIDEILANKEIQSLLKTNNLSMTDVEKNFISLYSYIIRKNICLNCDGKSCAQDVTGYLPYIEYDKRFIIDFKPCDFANALYNNKVIEDNLITLCCRLDNCNSDDLYSVTARTNVYKIMQESYNNYMNKTACKGIFLNGPYGCGKSYILGCLAKKYAADGMEVIFAYFPDLVRKIKSSVATSSVEYIIDDLKTIDVLFLDDFGGETISPFIRDEVLNPILQYRMENKLMTYMTSNLSKELLHQHLADSTKDYDDIKASRVEERIKTLMDFVELKDQNYRDKK